MQISKPFTCICRKVKPCIIEMWNYKMFLPTIMVTPKLDFLMFLWYDLMSLAIWKCWGMSKIHWLWIPNEDFLRSIFFFYIRWDLSFDILKDIRPLVLWMANSLEMLHFFQQNLQADFLLDPAVSLPAGSRQSLLRAQEEAFIVLEDVVTYTFQQTVYYLTKVNTCI